MRNAEDQQAVLEPVMLEALDWLVRLDVGATTADVQALREWRARSPAHDAAFREVATFRRLARALPEPSPTVSPFHQRPVSRRALFAGGGAIAASVAGAALVRPPLGLWPSLAELLADHYTGPGQRFAFAPTSGVTVDMNSRTAVSRTDGGVRLINGEAFVTVAPRATPFTVAAADAQAITRAAAFNIRSTDAEVCVTCVSGVLESRRSGEAQLIQAGEALTYDRAGRARRPHVDVALAVAWRRGLLIFDGAPLSEVVAEINRYRSGRLVLANPTVATRPVNAVFHTAQIENAVAQIQQLQGVTLTRLPGGVVLIS
jgi:transmembrane sensor